MMKAFWLGRSTPPVPVQRRLSTRQPTYFSPIKTSPEIFISQEIIPLILISAKAYAKIWYYIRSAMNLRDEEVSWFGTVDWDKKTHIMTIDDVFILKQNNTTMSTSIAPNALIEFWQSQPEEVTARIAFWGHYHPHGCTDPSPKDNEQLLEFADNNDFFIRGIFTADGKLCFTVMLTYDNKPNIIVMDAPWDHVDPSNFFDSSVQTQTEKDFADAVKTFVPPPNRRSRTHHIPPNDRRFVQATDPIIPPYASQNGTHDIKAYPLAGTIDHRLSPVIPTLPSAPITPTFTSPQRTGSATITFTSKPSLPSENHEQPEPSSPSDQSPVDTSEAPTSDEDPDTTTLEVN